VWHENGERQQCEAASEEKLAAKLEKVTERLESDAPNMTLHGADLIAFYLSPDRLPVHRQWSRKHAHTQRRLCERSAAPVIDTIIVHSELYFCDAYWPAFREIDFLRALRRYAARQSRRGA
jgi:Putative undecaprenyl diphosphate synthase